MVQACSGGRRVHPHLSMLRFGGKREERGEGEREGERGRGEVKRGEGRGRGGV